MGYIYMYVSRMENLDGGNLSRKRKGEMNHFQSSLSYLSSSSPYLVKEVGSRYDLDANTCCHTLLFIGQSRTI